VTPSAILTAGKIIAKAYKYRQIR